jgi:hypothetical protein
VACADVWTVVSTARTIRRFTAEPVDDATIAKCLQAATCAPSGANAQERRFIVVRSPGQRAVIALGPLRRRPLADVIFRDHWGADPGAPARRADEATGAPHE